MTSYHLQSNYSTMVTVHGGPVEFHPVRATPCLLLVIASHGRSTCAAGCWYQLEAKFELCFCDISVSLSVWWGCIHICVVSQGRLNGHEGFFPTQCVRLINDVSVRIWTLHKGGGRLKSSIFNQYLATSQKWCKIGT